jgi:DNA-binding NarL/FixJ family response regulator
MIVGSVVAVMLMNPWRKQFEVEEKEDDDVVYDTTNQHVNEGETYNELVNHCNSNNEYIQPELIPHLNSALINIDEDRVKVKLLTKRELEVLIFVAKGNFNKDIALSLDISERTVKNHISNIFRKIDVEDRTQAAVFAIKNNLIRI